MCLFTFIVVTLSNLATDTKIDFPKTRHLIKRDLKKEKQSRTPLIVPYCRLIKCSFIF